MQSPAHRGIKRTKLAWSKLFCRSFLPSILPSWQLSSVTTFTQKVNISLWFQNKEVLFSGHKNDNQVSPFWSKIACIVSFPVSWVSLGRKCWWVVTDMIVNTDQMLIRVKSSLLCVSDAESGERKRYMERGRERERVREREKERERERERERQGETDQERQTDKQRERERERDWWRGWHDEHKHRSVLWMFCVFTFWGLTLITHVNVHVFTPCPHHCDDVDFCSFFCTVSQHVP